MMEHSLKMLTILIKMMQMIRFSLFDVHQYTHIDWMYMLNLVLNRTKKKKTNLRKNQMAIKTKRNLYQIHWIIHDLNVYAAFLKNL